MQFEATVADDLVKPHGERSTAQVGSAITERVSEQPVDRAVRWASVIRAGRGPARATLPPRTGQYRTG